MFPLHDIISKYAKSIWSFMEITRKENKRTRRMRKEYIAVYGEYADRIFD